VGDNGEWDREFVKGEPPVGSPEFAGDGASGWVEAESAKEPVDVIRQRELKGDAIHLGGVAAGGVEGADGRAGAGAGHKVDRHASVM
jgi:hypothetical protein